MNLIALILLAVLTAGIIAVAFAARRVGREATELTATLRGFRALRPALVELREETAAARLAAECLRHGERLP